MAAEDKPRREGRWQRAVRDTFAKGFRPWLLLQLGAIVSAAITVLLWNWVASWKFLGFEPEERKLADAIVRTVIVVVLAACTKVPQFLKNLVVARRLILEDENKTLATELEETRTSLRAYTDVEPKLCLILQSPTRINSRISYEGSKLDQVEVLDFSLKVVNEGRHPAKGIRIRVVSALDETGAVYPGFPQERVIADGWELLHEESETIPITRFVPSRPGFVAPFLRPKDDAVRYPYRGPGPNELHLTFRVHAEKLLGAEAGTWTLTAARAQSLYEAILSGKIPDSPALLQVSEETAEGQ